MTEQQSRDLETALYAAAQLRDNLDLACSRDNRPPDMTDEQCSRPKPTLRLLATRAAAYVTLERKDYPKAQTELTPRARPRHESGPGVFLARHRDSRREQVKTGSFSPSRCTISRAPRFATRLGASQ